VGLAVALALIPIAQIGAERWAQRFAQSGADFSSRGGRAAVWRDSARMLGAAPLVGIGFGAFAATYPTFRSPDVRAKYDHAHNDALQVLAEGGALAALLALLLLVPVGREILRSLRGERGAIAVGFAAGLTAMLGHALIDFGFHIPSNAAVAAALAGALSGFGWNARS
jgi:O-antigen ligase